MAQRNIELRYKPEQIGQDTIDRVCRYYTNNTELFDILQIINGPRPSNFTLNLADIYAIINIAAQQKKIKQRKKFLEFELKINDFVTIYKGWKQGIKPKELLGLFPNCKVAIDRLLRSIQTRYRLEKERLDVVTDSAAREILTFAQPRMIKGESGWWIPVEDIRPELIAATGLKPLELEEDILIDHRRDIEEVSTVNPEQLDDNQKPQSRPITHVRGIDEPQEEYQSEEEVLSDEVFNVEAKEEEQIEEETPIKEKLSDFL